MMENLWNLSYRLGPLTLCGVFFAAAVIAAVLAWRWKRALADKAAECAFYRDVLDHLPGYVFVKDADHRFCYRYANWDAESADVKKLDTTDEILFEQEADAIRRQDVEIIRTGSSSVSLKQLHLSGGRKIDVKVWKKLYRRSNGSQLIIGIGTDITNERELENKLAANIRELDSAMLNEQSINRCLTQLASNNDFRSCVQFCLGELGARAGADRCAIFRYEEESGKVSKSEEWCRLGASDRRHLPERLDEDRFGSFLKELRGHRDVMIPDVAAPPAGMEPIAGLLADFGVRAAMISGFWINGRLAGAAVFYFSGSPHSFTEADLYRLHNVCNLYVLSVERVSRMEEIVENRTLKEQIFSSIALPVVLFDLDFNIVMANPSACETTKSTEKELLGKKCYNALCNCDAPPDWCPMKKVVQEKRSISIDFAGHGRQYLLTLQPIYDHTGKMVYVVETAVDVTEQKVQAEQLAAKSLLLSRVAEVSRITYFIREDDYDVRLIGGSTDIGVSKIGSDPINLWLWAIPEDRPEMARQRKLLESGQSSVEFVCRSDASGGRRSFRLVVIRGENDSHLGIIQDITDSVNLENQHNALIGKLENYVENERITNSCLSQIMLDDDFDRNVEGILRIIGTQMKGCRVFFGIYDEFGRTFEISHEWCGRDVAPLREKPGENLIGQYLEWYDRFMHGEMMAVPDVGNSPYAEALASSGCRRLISVPIRVGDELSGVLCVGFIYESSEFSVQERNILRSSAQILALACIRQRQRQTKETQLILGQIVMNAIPIPVVLFSAEGQMICCSPAAAALGKTPIDVMLRRPCYESLCGNAGIPDCCPIQKTLRTKEPYSCKLRLHGHDCLVTATPVRNRVGTITHVLETLVDLTEIEENRRKLEAAEKAVDSAKTDKASLIAAISHEMRSPLNSVIGFSELLRNEKLPPEELREYAESINRSGNALLTLLNDILDFSRLEAGLSVIEEKYIDLEPLLRETQSVFHCVFRKKELGFSLNLPLGLPQLKLDGMRLRQILLNLLGNAVNFSTHGEITLTVRFRPQDDKTGDLTIQVKDTGLPRESVNALFDEKNEEPNILFKSLGLGLVISRKLIAAMGGTVQVEGEAGQEGLVLDLPEIAYRQETAAPLPAGSEAAPSGHETLPLRILVVDDVPMNLKVLAAILRKLGELPFVAHSGPEALEILKKEKIDLVLTDIWMPGMNGDELAAAIHSLNGMANLTIYAVTADMEAKSHCAEDVFCDILHKPVTLDGLRKLLNQIRNKWGKQ